MWRLCFTAFVLPPATVMACNAYPKSCDRERFPPTQIPFDRPDGALQSVDFQARLCYTGCAPNQ